MSSSLQSVQLGVGAMLVYSFFNTAQLVGAKVMYDSGWPSWHMMAMSYAVILLPFSAACVLTGTPGPSWHQVKWMIVRTIFVEIGFVCAATAVHISNAPGDVQALTSVNVVVAAAIGRLVLKERLRWIHSLALVSSMLGALLISRPGFLFGGAEARDLLFLAHLLALAAGGARAMALICARKCGQVSALHLSLTQNVVAGVVFLIVPFTPLFELHSMDACWQEPWAATGWLAFHVVASLGSLIGGSLGSKLCPAAVSATVFTGSGMVFGYGSQVLLFGRSPDMVTLLGSALMLLAVGIMTVFRVQPPAQTDAEVEDAASQPKNTSELPDAACVEDRDDNESLISFAASEFAEFDAHADVVHESLRLRRRAVEPQAIGNSLTTIAKVVVDAGASA